MRIATFAAAAVVFLFAGTVLQAQESRATIVLKDGRALEGRVDSVSGTSLKWWLPGLPQPQTYQFDQIDFIDFPQPPEWLEVMSLFDKGRYAEAAERFKAISLQRDSKTHYPAPGNFATLAERRLLDCYRRLRRPQDIAYTAKRIEWNKLPASERTQEGIIDCWAAVGDGNWEEAEKRVAATREEIPAVSSVAAELDYVAGLVHLGKGEGAEASVLFARAYGPDACADAALAADAMRRAIELVLADPERRDELRALVRLYAGLHGNGQLWEGSADSLKNLLTDDSSGGGK